jgi:eukaryotic-like serine/threonine-protein kinase
MTPLKPGDHLDHYRIDGLVARTPLASTFRGTDLGTGRKVVIKVPAEIGADPILSERFRREEEIGQKLDHPGVVGVLRDGYRSHVYIVREWAEGRTLREILLEQAPLPSARAVRIAVGICEALYYIHSCGVVHRDLKPENVIIDSVDRIKLIDFGIAVSGGSNRLVLSDPLDATGTPDYISPEEVKGIRGDARGDIYALGVVLYEMLTGIVPFQGCNPLVVMNERLISDPAPLRSIIPEISPWLESIVRRALERDPRRRYASAFEFARALDGRVQPESTTTAKPRFLQQR